MRPMSLLDMQSDQPEDDIMDTNDARDAALNELTLAVKVIESNYVTKEELAALNGKLDVLNGKLDALTSRVDGIPSQLELVIKTQIDQAFKTHTEMMHQVFATKAELATALNQQTWRMAAFGSLLISAGFAFARYL